MATLMVINLDSLAQELKRRGHTLVDSLAQSRPELVLLDGRKDVLPGLIKALREAGCPVVCVVDAGSPEQARELVIQGASRLLYRTPEFAEVERLLGSPGEEARDSMLARIFERHRDTMENSVATIGRVAADWAEASGDERSLAILHAHRLAGTLGSFGLTRGTELARGIERDLQAGSASAVTPRVNQLREEIRGAPTPPPRPPVAAPEPPGPERTVLVVDDDSALAEALQAEGQARGVRVLTAGDLAAARRLLGESPQVVVLDLMSSGGEDGLAFLRELSDTHPELPVIVLTAGGALLDRVEVARLGGRGFLVKPLTASEVLEEVSRQLDGWEAQLFKVLAVDDDPVSLDCLRDALAGPEIALTAVNDPLDFWTALEEVSPDLLLLDLEMPHVHGLDLLKALRNDSRYAALPVLVLTAHPGPNTVSEVFQAGADDFVSKPFLVPELRARVRTRLERFQLLRNLSETDALTRLANRRKTSQGIEQLLLLAARQRQPFCLAVLDIDHFKRVNDTRGHAVGDQVLRGLADHLRASFRGEDVVGRWGGEEFVVGMYGMSLEDAVARLNRVLEAARRTPFLTDPPEVVSFSAGVAQFGLHGRTLMELYRQADAALYAAKAQGRSRVLPASVGRQ